MPQFKFNTISRTDIQSSLGGGQMISAIDYDGPHHLLVTGCPGSGKTTISIMRAERLVILKKQILLITYQDLLKNSLVNIASKELAPHIVKFYKWFSKKFRFLQLDEDESTMIELMKDWKGIDEIIIDEGQDFESRIYRSLILKCKKLTVGADNAQKVHDNGLKASEIDLEMKKGGTVLPFFLQYNYRNTFEVYNFARHFLPYNERVNNNLAIDKIPKGKGAIPTVFIVPNEATRLAQLKILLNDAGDRNIAVLVYHVDEVDAYHQQINEMGIRCSKHHNDHHVGSEMENVLVTTFKSAKGLEFQVVIMPNMETAMNETYKTEEHYYIACTRARENLFLLTKGGSLPNYFNGFDASSYQVTRTEATAAPKKVKIPDVSAELDDLPF
jgi:superfamily I DNA/RNA helicase